MTQAAPIHGKFPAAPAQPVLSGVSAAVTTRPHHPAIAAPAPLRVHPGAELLTLTAVMSVPNSWLVVPGTAEGTARLSPAGRAPASPHATATVLRQRSRQPPPSVLLPSLAQQVNNMSELSATNAAQLANTPTGPRRLTAPNMAPNFQQQENGCSFPKSARHAPNLAALPTRRQQRQAISPRKLQQY